MRSLILVAAGLLAACATVAQPPPVPGPGNGYVCRQQSFEEFIGQVASPEVGAQMLRVSGARTIRWVQPDTMITMEYSEQRLTVRLASNNQIVTASCG